MGEFGSLAELSGAAPVRGGKAVDPALLSAAFRLVEGGAVKRSGYRFVVYLLDRFGQPVGERVRGGFAKGRLDAKAAARYWCAYAWPVASGKTGNRTFFVNQNGDISWTEDARYSGDRGPDPAAAFRAGGPPLRGKPALGAPGQDGNVWTQGG